MLLVSCDSERGKGRRAVGADGGGGLLGDLKVDSDTDGVLGPQIQELQVER